MKLMQVWYHVEIDQFIVYTYSRTWYHSRAMKRGGFIRVHKYLEGTI